MQMLQQSIFGKIPIEDEKKIAIEISEILDDLYPRIYLPTVAFDDLKIKWDMMIIKRKLEEMGV